MTGEADFPRRSCTLPDGERNSTQVATIDTRPADQETRILRARHADLAGQVDRAIPFGSSGTPRRLVQIYNGGSMPSSPDHFFLAYPIELDGAETEGGTGTPVDRCLSADRRRCARPRTVRRRHPDGVRRRGAVGRGKGRIKQRRIARLLTLQYPCAKPDPLVGQCHQRQRFDDPDLCDHTHVVDVRLFQRSALQTGLHRRPGGTPRDLLHDGFLSHRHATVLLEPACHAVSA